MLLIQTKSVAKEVTLWFTATLLDGARQSANLSKFYLHCRNTYTAIQQQESHLGRVTCSRKCSQKEQTLERRFPRAFRCWQTYYRRSCHRLVWHTSFHCWFVMTVYTSCCVVLEFDRRADKERDAIIIARLQISRRMTERYVVDTRWDLPSDAQHARRRW